MKTLTEIIEELAYLSEDPIVPLDTVADYLPSEVAEGLTSYNISETFVFEIFKHIMPGLERIIVVLRSQDYTYSEIGFIIGMPSEEISRVVYKIKNRLMKLNYDGLEPKKPDLKDLTKEV